MKEITKKIKKKESCPHLVVRTEFNINSDSALLVCESCGAILSKCGVF